MLIKDIIERTRGMGISLTANILPKYSNIIRITTEADENDGDYVTEETDVKVNTIEEFLITVNVIIILKKLRGKYSNYSSLSESDIQAMIDFDKMYALNEFAEGDEDEIAEIEAEYANLNASNYTLLNYSRDYGVIDMLPRGNEGETEVLDNGCILIRGCHSLESVKAVYFDETGYSSVLSV